MAKNGKSPHPEWALRHKGKGMELRIINGKYYIYQVTSKYDPLLKRSKKVTGKILGTVTEKDGFIESDKRQLQKSQVQAVDVSSICVRESGFTGFINSYSTEITNKLKQFFPEEWTWILYMAYCRLVHQSPIKNMGFHVSKSMLAVDNSFALNDKAFSDALRRIGNQRSKATNYLQSFVSPGDHVMVDMTNIFSASNKMHYAKDGYNSDMIFDKQFNLMYIYSAKLFQPVFYRLYAGNIREVTAFKMCLKESGLSDAIVIADKGFYSQANVDLLKAESVKFIMPIKRDSSLINYDQIQGANQHFKYNDRYIWYSTWEKDGIKIIGFRDDKLKVQEEKDYLDRIKSVPESYSEEGFHKRRNVFGTLTIVTNTGLDAEQVYSTYKSRNTVEVMFDGLKNIIAADHTYMQNEEGLQGWMFVNHIALQWYYIIYKMLHTAKLLSQYSVSDFVKHLYEIKKVKINNQWLPEPQIKATEKILKKLNISIT
jgi:transposase